VRIRKHLGLGPLHHNRHGLRVHHNRHGLRVQRKGELQWLDNHKLDLLFLLRINQLLLNTCRTPVLLSQQGLICKDLGHLLKERQGSVKEFLSSQLLVHKALKEFNRRQLIRK
jgi:hypothetical protein